MEPDSVARGRTTLTGRDGDKHRARHRLRRERRRDEMETNINF